MYRLLIVDDEYEIRKGLESVDWHSLGIDHVGSCEHGLEAYQRIMAEPVDILLTDIRMPFMDGFELIRQATGQFPYLKTVILTGYNEFNYAQQGIRLGISDYLLKPAKKADIAATFGGIIRELDQKRQLQLRSETLERKAKLSANLLRERFMERLLFQPVTPEELEEGASAGEMFLNGLQYSVHILRLDRKQEQNGFYSAKEWKLILFALHNLLTEFWDEQTGGYHFIHPETGECFLLHVRRNPLSDEAPLAELDKALAAVTESVQRLRGLHLSTVSIVIGPYIHEAEHIHLSALTAAQSLRNRQGRELRLREADVLAIQTTDREEGRPEQEEPHKEETVLTFRSIVDEAIHYIDHNYEKSVSLQDLAAHVHVNPNYLSTLFRKTTGRNYIQYLTERRMQRATELLRGSGFKVYEVCEMVGYSNTAYFSELFRKHMGLTPNEYRSMHSQEGAGMH